jgi:hypothetical protein
LCCRGTAAGGPLLLARSVALTSGHANHGRSLSF